MDQAQDSCNQISDLTWCFYCMWFSETKCGCSVTYFPALYTSAVSKRLIPLSYAVVINSSATFSNRFEIFKRKMSKNKDLMSSWEIIQYVNSYTKNSFTLPNLLFEPQYYPWYIQQIRSQHLKMPYLYVMAQWLWWLLFMVSKTLIDQLCWCFVCIHRHSFAYEWCIPANILWRQNCYWRSCNSVAFTKLSL